MMSHELSRSSDSSRTNSREILEVVLHKKGEEEDRHGHPHHHHHHHHNQQQQHQHHQHQHQQQHQQQQQQQLHHAQHSLQQLHQHRSADSSGRLSAMLVRTTHLHHNHLGDLSHGPSSFSRKSLSRQSLDSASHVSEGCDPRDQQHPGYARGGGRGGVGAFLNSLALLAVASLILGTMALLLLASVAQEHAEARISRSLGKDSSSTSALKGTSGSAGEREKDTNNGGGRSKGSPGRGGDSAEQSLYSLSKSAQLSSYSFPSSTSASSKRPLDHQLTSSDFSKAGDLQADQPGSDSAAQNRAQDRSQGRAFTGGDDSESEASGFASHPRLLEAAVAMATLVLVADLCCLMVCCMQCFFAAKLITMYEGEERMLCQRIGDPFALHHINRAIRRRVIHRSMPQSPHMIPMRRRGPEVRASMCVIHQHRHVAYSSSYCEIDFYLMVSRYIGLAFALRLINRALHRRMIPDPCLKAHAQSLCDGEVLKSAKYLRECSSSRFIAVMGFFLSIPAFLVALVLVVIVKLHPGPALTSGVVLGVGGLFCVLSVMQNLYHWRVEKTRADEGLPVYEGHRLLRERPMKLPPSPCHGQPPPPPPPPSHPSSPPTAVATPGEQGSSQKNELATLV